jgi:26S proteasome regulatory subunit N10
MSMEEEAARQAAVNAPPPSSQGATAVPIAATAVAVATAPDGVVAVQQPSGPTTAAAVATDEGDEAILQQALALSEGQHGGAPDVEMTEEHDGDENLTEEEMIARAIEMSMRPEPEAGEK